MFKKNEDLSLISMIIPCRNEEKYIGKCLDSIIEQDYLHLRQGFGGQAKEKLEVLVVDGMSEDKTREIIKKYSEKHPFIKLLENPKKFTPFGLNIGIREAKGEIIIRMDSHAGYERDYISKCVKYSKEYKTDNVGGVIKTLPAESTPVAKAIAICLSSPFGAASDFRLGSKTPKLVDTVFGGCYKKEVFNKIGLFDEKLIRGQDLEFNLRLKKAGGKTLLAPDIVASYYPSSNFQDFLKHTFIDGIWITYPLKFRIRAFSLRHLLPLVFVLSLICSLLSSFLISKSFLLLFLFILLIYFLVSIFFSFKIVAKEKELRLLFLMPIAFACRHIGYGFGSIIGLIKLFLPVK